MTDPPTPADTPPGAPPQYDRVPPPVAPGDGAAWYAPDVRAQHAVGPGVVATIRQVGDGFAYGVREPSLSRAEQRTLDRVRAHFSGSRRRRCLSFFHPEPNGYQVQALIGVS